MAGLIQYIERDSPRQAEIVSDLRCRIISGEFLPGDRLPAVSEVVGRFGASNRTVQRALEHLENAGFIVKISRKGTFVSDHPPHLSNIGLLFPIPENLIGSFQLHKALKKHAEHTCKGHRSSSKIRFSYFYSSTVLSASGDHKILTDALESHQLAGLVVAQGNPIFENSTMFNWENLPLVHFGFGRKAGATVLQVDYAKFYEMALDFLHSRGRRRVAFLVSSDQFKKDSHLLNIVQTLLKVRGMHTRRQWVQAIALDAAGWAANYAHMLFSNTERPDSVIVGDDNFVSYATQAIAELKVKVPQQVDVVAHCNFPYPPDAAVPVARLGFDVGFMLDTAIDIIKRKRSNQQAPDLLEIEPILKTDYS